MPASETDVSWAAGLFDGEGCIFIAKPGNKIRHHVLRLVLTMVHKPTVEEFCAVVACGSVNEQRREHSNNERFAWTWTGSSANGEKVLRLFQRYLRTKRAECDLALEFRIGANTRPGVRTAPEEYARREGLRIELQKLKRYEWRPIDKAA